MNELDFILLFVILVCVAICFRRGFIRVLISIVGMYFVVLVAGYLYHPIGWTLADAFGLGLTAMHNFAFFLVALVVVIVAELISYAVFEETTIPSLRKLDNVLGALVGIFYGAFWAALMLVLIQYGIVRTGGTLTDFVLDSTLTPNLNDLFDNVVLTIVRPLFVDGLPVIYKSIYLVL
ncbi:MAG: CvpA family protein [Anaerolineae bacterium]